MAAPASTRKWKHSAMRIDPQKSPRPPYEADLPKIDYIIIHQ